VESIRDAFWDFVLCISNSNRRFGEHIFSTLLSLHPSLVQIFTSFNIRDQTLHPYRTTGKIMILYILICCF
jgi:hypothetical protein